MAIRCAGTIDPARIGISGVSAGGAAAIGAAGGVAASGIAADPRIKAMVLYEPGRPNVSYSLADASTIAVPYLIMGGDATRKRPCRCPRCSMPRFWRRHASAS